MSFKTVYLMFLYCSNSERQVFADAPCILAVHAEPKGVRLKRDKYNRGTGKMTSLRLILITMKEQNVGKHFFARRRTTPK